MWWLNYHGMLTIYGGNGWVLLVSGFVNKYTYFDVVRKYKLLVDERRVCGSKFFMGGTTK